MFSTISRSSCPGIGVSAHDGAWLNNPIDTPCFRMVIWYPSIGKFSRGLMTDHLYPLGSSGSSPSYSWTTLDLLMPPPGAPYVTPPSPCARRGGWPPLVPWQVRCWWSSDFSFCWSWPFTWLTSSLPPELVRYLCVGCECGSQLCWRALHLRPDGLARCHCGTCGVQNGVLPQLGAYFAVINRSTYFASTPK
jgi:hypothetical protein